MALAHQFIRKLKETGQLNKIAMNQDIASILLDAAQNDRGFVIGTFTKKPKLPAFVVSGIIDKTVQRPVRLKLVQGEYWVGSMYERIARFDSNWSFLGWVGLWGEPFASGKPTDRYCYLRSFDVDLENDRIAVCSEWRHCVSVFKYSTWEHLFTIGDGGAGNVEDGRLWNPVDVLFVNGDVLVVSYNGHGIGGSRHGHVTLYSGKDGSVIKTLLTNTGRIFPWFYECQNPSRAFLYGNQLYVSYYVNHLIGCFDFDLETMTLSYNTAYFKPQGINAVGLYPRGIYVTENEVYITMHGPKRVGILNRHTHDLINILGTPKWEDQMMDSYTPSTLWDVWDVLPIKEGILIADYGNNRVGLLPYDYYIDVPFELDREIPADAQVLTDYFECQVDIEKRIARVPAAKIPGMRDKFIIPYTL